MQQEIQLFKISYFRFKCTLVPSSNGIQQNCAAEYMSRIHHFGSYRGLMTGLKQILLPALQTLGV